MRKPRRPLHRWPGSDCQVVQRTVLIRGACTVCYLNDPVEKLLSGRPMCAMELQPQSVVDPPCGGTCCPLCGKAGIRLVAFTDATGVLHMIGVGPMPCDSS